MFVFLSSAGLCAVLGLRAVAPTERLNLILESRSVCYKRWKKSFPPLFPLNIFFWIEPFVKLDHKEQTLFTPYILHVWHILGVLKTSLIYKIWKQSVTFWSDLVYNFMETRSLKISTPKFVQFRMWNSKLSLQKGRISCALCFFLSFLDRVLDIFRWMIKIWLFIFS